MAEGVIGFGWELKGTVEEQIKSAFQNTEKLSDAIKELNVDLSKLDADKIKQNITKNVNDAEKALYKLMDAREKVEKALSRNMTMRSDGFIGIDETSLLRISARLDDIIGRIMNIGAEAGLSKTAVKNLLNSLSVDIALKEAKNSTTVADKGLDKQVKERAKEQKEAIKDIAQAFKDADDAAKVNAKNQDLIVNALARIATARANLSAASEKGNQQEIAHAQLLMRLLDNVTNKLTAMKGKFLGEKDALSSVLGTTYQRLMGSVNQAVRDIGNVGSAVVQSPVDMLALRGDSLRRIQQVMEEMTGLQGRLKDLRAEQEKGIFRPKGVELITKRYAALKTELDSLLSSMQKIGEMGNIYGGLAHLRGYTGPQSALGEDAWTAAKREAEIREVAAAAAEKHKQKLNELQEAFDRQAKAEERANAAAKAEADAQERSQQRAHAQAQARKQNSQEIRKQAEELVRLRLELLKTQATELSSLIKKGGGIFSTQQYQQLREALRSVVQEMTTLKNVMADMGNYSTRDLFGFGRGSQNWSPLIQNGQILLQTQQAVRQLSLEEEKLMKSIDQASNAFNNQNRILSDLQMMANNYLSLWGARDFLNKIIEIGGQLEMQRLSIGAILGDTAHANDLFDKIKSLAVQSPFGVVELDQYTKQLSAYGFKYDELYDMTKRLADISAGAGTDVSRLALALGHVRAEAALSGYTLRQFAMNNIPMVSELAKLLTETEGNKVSVADVRKRVRNKEIGYEEVETVIKRLTDEGGMFYNMQEVVSQSVKARFKNLKDALDIMYGEMAESNVGDLLKVVASALTELSRHWKEFYAVAKSTLIVLGAYKAMMLSTTVLLGKESAAVEAGAAAKVKADRANLRLASSYRSLTIAEQASLGTRGKALIMADALALSEKELTADGLARQVALNKLTKAEANQAIQLANLSAIEKAHIWNTVASVRTYGALTAWVNGFSMSVTKLGMALKSLVWNPMTAIFAAVGIATEVWQKNNEEVERARELNEDIFNRATEGIKNIKTMMGETGLSFTLNGRDVDFGSVDFLKKGGAFEVTPAAQMNTAEMITAMERWSQFIKEYSANPNSILNNAFADEQGNVRKLTEQYELLGKAVGETAEAYVWLKDASQAAQFAEDLSNSGYMDDSLITNINDYAGAVKDYNDAVNKSVVANRQFWSAVLKAARAHTGFSGTLKREGIDAENLSAQIKVLIEDQERYAGAIELAKNAAHNMGKILFEFIRTPDSNPFYVNDILGTRLGYNTTIQDFYASVEDTRDTMEQDIDLWVEGMKQGLQDAGWKLNELTEGQKQAVALAIAETVAKASKGTDDIRKEVEELIKNKFGIKIDVDTVNAAINVATLKKSLEDLVGHDWHIDIKAVSNFDDLVSNIRKSYKSAEEYFKNTKPLAIKMGIDVSGGLKRLGVIQRGVLLDNWKKKNPDKDATMYEQFLEQWDKMAEAFTDATDFSKATGISLKDTNKGNKGGGSKTDQQLKQWKEHLKELENFYKVYKRNAQYMSNDDAIQKALDSGVFSDPKKLPKNIDDYLTVLKDFRKKVEAEMGKKPSTERKSFLTDLLTKIDEKEFEVKTKEAAKAILDQLEKALKEQGKRWDLYKKILDATGNKEQAGQIAFGRGVSFDNYAQELRAELEQALAGNDKVQGKSIDELMGMSDDALRKLNIFAENTDGIYKKLQLLREEEQKVKSEEVELFVDALKNAKSLDTELGQITLKYQKARDAIRKQYTDKSGVLSAEGQVLINNTDENENRDKANKQWEYFKKNTEGWGEIFSNLDRASDSAISSMIANLEKALPKIQASEEATKALYEALDKLRAQQRERNPFGALYDSIVQGSRLRQLAGNGNAFVSGKFTPNATPAKYYGLQEGKNYTRDDIKGLARGKGQDLPKAITAIGSKFQALQKVLSPVIDLFDALGEEDISDIFKIGNDMFGSAAGVAEGFNSLKNLFDEDSGIGKALGAAGPWGAAAGAALSMVSGVFALHDKALQEEIDASKARQKEMENLSKNLETALERTLGSIYETRASDKDLKKLAEYQENFVKANTTSGNFVIDLMNHGNYSYISEDAKSAIDEALKSQSYYDTQFAMLQLQRDELQKQMDAEGEKKDSNADAIADYKQQIVEMDDQIKHFAEDMAKAIYDIDIKSWATELGDALFEAWQKGEDGAEAFKNKAREIITDVAKKIVAAKLIETAMQPVLNAVVSEMERTDGKLNEKSIENIATAMEQVGNILPSAYNTMMDGIDKGLQRAGLGSMKDDADTSSTTASKVIQGGFTENETGLLLSYINAMRADLSFQRQDVYGIRQFLEGNFSEMPIIAQAQLQQLQQIARNTLRNADAADSIYELLHRLAPDGTKIKVG